MSCKFSPLVVLPLLSIILALVIGSFFAAASQHSSEETRGIKPREYAERLQNQIAQKRPPSKGSKVKVAVKYKALTNDNALVTEGVDVGVTLWQLRPARKTDAKEVREAKRIIVIKKGKTEEKTMMMTPARAESEALFSDGDLLKFTIESPFRAYIYILDREQYADGTMSDPYLVFPAREVVEGFPGHLIFIPGDDIFELKRLSDLNPTDGKTAEKTAEIFTVILSEQPIKELPPLASDEQIRKLDKQQFEGWQSDWGGRVWRFEKQDSASRTKVKKPIAASLTKAEKQAGEKGGILTGDDPHPQTVYHVERKSKAKLLFDVSIKIRK